MKIFSNIKKLVLSANIYFLFSCVFILWVFCFRNWLLGIITLDSDASAYYEHFEYLIENLSRGVYPLWEPTRQYGVPTEFFMRRIGSYNPIYMIILLMRKVGISFNFAYLSFLIMYYFTGIIGFYLLAKKIFQNQHLAFIAAVLFLFSSLGTRLFDSYFLFTTIPMIWFFYFFLSFLSTPRKHLLMGVTFTSMILLITYIPFYFVNILATFVITAFLINLKKIRTIMIGVFSFCKSNRLFCLLCVFFVMISLIPGYQFFQSSKKGEFVLPQRSYNVDLEEGVSSLSVDIETIKKWGIEEDFASGSYLPNSYFSDLRNIKFAVLYLPSFIFIIAFLGMFTRINRTVMFCFLWAALIYVISSPKIGPIYEFLYDHLFYYRYFRNLHFFLWMIIVPIFVIFIVEQFKNIIYAEQNSRKPVLMDLILIFLVHVIYLIFVLVKGYALITTYFVILASSVFFSLIRLRKISFEQPLAVYFLLGIILIQPLEVFYYFQNNIGAVNFVNKIHPLESAVVYRYQKEKSYLAFKLPEEINYKQRSLAHEQKQKLIVDTDPKSPSSYMGMKSLVMLLENFGPDIIGQYYRSPILIYDQVELMSEDHIDFDRIEDVFMNNRNIAFVTELLPEDNGHLNGSDNTLAQGITMTSKEVSIEEYDIDHIKFKTMFDKNKFLVLNNNYHSSWMAYIDGEKADLRKANIAFRGLWLPPGNHHVEMIFGSRLKRISNFVFIGIFQIAFIFLIYLCLMSRKENTKNVV